MRVVNPPLPPGSPVKWEPSSHRSTSAFLLVAASTAVAATADTLNRLVLLELRLGHSADTCGIEIRFFRLDTAQATQLLIALLLPLGNQVRIGILVLEQEIIKLLRDCFFLVVKFIDVS